MPSLNRLFILSLACLAGSALAAPLSYPIVDSGVRAFYSDTGTIAAPHVGAAFYGQDAHYAQHPASYTSHANGSVSDNVTGLMWEADMGEKMTLAEAQAKARNSRLGGHADWRVPTLKELYSLINFSGVVRGPNAVTPFIDTRYFKQPLGGANPGEREIDAQTWSATPYLGKTMGRDETLFGVNFVDGRIKGYPVLNPRSHSPNRMYFRLVRGNPAYGQNDFKLQNNGTIADRATGLVWQQGDSEQGMDWQHALAYCENLQLAGHDDWRLPSAKALQSIVDYKRSPQATGTAALDPLFRISQISDPRSQQDYPLFWTATTHLDGPHPGDHAAYLCFGECLGQMRGQILDVHGAGAQRSDPKSGRPEDYPRYFGPQGDVSYVFNYVRCVRSAQ